MKIIYAGEEIDRKLGCYTCFPSVFLAGPTPRSSEVKSWRPEAIEEFRSAGYDGKIIIPEPRDGSTWPDYDDNFEWEIEGLTRSHIIMFWIPRCMKTMPALTTNVEFGYCIGLGRTIVLGSPPECPDYRKNRYLEMLCKEESNWSADKSVHKTLKDTVQGVINVFERRKGEEQP